MYCKPQVQLVLSLLQGMREGASNASLACFAAPKGDTKDSVILLLGKLYVSCANHNVLVGSAILQPPALVSLLQFCASLTLFLWLQMRVNQRNTRSARP